MLTCYRNRDSTVHRCFEILSASLVRDRGNVRHKHTKTSFVVGTIGKNCTSQEVEKLVFAFRARTCSTTWHVCGGHLSLSTCSQEHRSSSKFCWLNYRLFAFITLYWFIILCNEKRQAWMNTQCVLMLWRNNEKRVSNVIAVRPERKGEGKGGEIRDKNLLY